MYYGAINNENILLGPLIALRGVWSRSANKTRLRWWAEVAGCVSYAARTTVPSWATRRCAAPSRHYWPECWRCHGPIASQTMSWGFPWGFPAAATTLATSRWSGVPDWGTSRGSRRLSSRRRSAAEFCRSTNAANDTCTHTYTSSDTCLLLFCCVEICRNLHESKRRLPRDFSIDPTLSFWVHVNLFYRIVSYRILNRTWTMNIFVRQNRQRDRQKTNYIQTRK